MAETQTVRCDVLVTMKGDIPFKLWLDTHEDKGMAREVEFISQNQEGNSLVRIEYTALGAHSVHVMRPYQESREWLRLATVTLLASRVL